MPVVIAQLAGVAVFVLVTTALGMRLRRATEARHAASLSRVSHAAFWLALVAPWTVGLFFPGPSALDRLVGLPPLPLAPALRMAAGGVMLLAGVAFMQLSINALGRRGRGAPSFKLTSSVVDTGVYALTRNPMSFGFYTACLGGALLSGSSYVLLYTVFGVIPAHLFNLKFFEELELRSRYGESYERYRADTPFLVPRLRPRASRTR